jgi:c-di-GMP-binding flagellar brake protein YcgR
MKKKTKEKRQSKRAFFTLEDNIAATIESQKEPFKVIPVSILSISSGGISFITARQKIVGIKESEPLIITGIQAPEPLGYIDKIEVEIRHILDLEVNVRVAVGCEFTNISDTYVTKIKDYVEYRLVEMGLEDKCIVF